MAQSALFPIEGRPVLRLHITGIEDSQKQLVRSLLDIEPGYLYSQDALSRGVRRLYALGRYTDVIVRAEPIEKAVILHVALTETARISEVAVAGDEDAAVTVELQNMVLKQRSYDAAMLDAMARRCEKTWESVGYFGARCTAAASAPDKNKVVVTITSYKGEPTKVASVEFAGDKKVESVFLMNEIAVRKGDVFSEKALKEDEKALRTAFFKRGFLTAVVRAERARSSAGIVVRFTITGGPRVSLKVRGGERFTEDSLKGLLKRAEDEPLTRGTLDAWRRAVLERYHSKGFGFADVRVESYYESTKNVVHHVLTIAENERAVVNTLLFPGANHFASQRLKDEVTAFVSELLDPSILSGDVNRQAVRALEDGAVGIADPPAMVSPADNHWLYRQDPARTYVPEAYRRALDAIRKLYLEQGYTRVEVGPLELVKASAPRYLGQRTPQHADVDIRIPIKEGPRSKIHLVAFSGTQAIDSDTLYNLSKLQPGAPYSALLVEETENEIQKAMEQRGYMYSRVEHVSEFSPTLEEVDLRFIVTEGPQVLVARVLVQGNDRTSEAVIRDRVSLTPGQPYSPDEAQNTKDELTKLEVFGATSVGMTDPEVPSEQKDVIVKLLERETQSIDLGIGFSTTQGLRGYIEYNERNLFGTAQLLTMRLQINRQLLFIPVFYNKWADVMAERYAQTFQQNAASVIFASIERQARIAWRTPRGLKLPGRPQLYAELINERLNTIPFSLDTGSFLVGVDLKPSSIIGVTIETSIAVNYLQCFPLRADDGTTADTAGQLAQCDPRNFGRVLAVVDGGFVNWKSGPTFVLDLRDNKINTRSGLLAVVKADAIVGQQFLPGGGSFLPADPRYAFIKLEAHVTGYIPIGKRAQLGLSAHIGNIFKLTGDESLLRAQLNERFFLGGRNTLRGYADRTVLPEDACVVEQSDPAPCDNAANRVEYDSKKVYTPVPGGFYWLLKSEFRFPVYGNFGAAVFVDAGNLYFSASAFNPLAVRANVGIGLRYETGVGSLALDLGFNPFFRDSRVESVGPFVYFYFGTF